ncbi:putative lipid II flippase FtsW [Sediminispirochaeta bajacaliforniensis]|uniref:putative lipid II flippase FtsW n=1 Tax=Sediminispirochaeta bajacaliforniensis TaxID=148 RepID=UPI00035E57CC|nr:putative lipid II flippase FtsW [Sediminispirochaeta bajacaliforniensis]
MNGLFAAEKIERKNSDFILLVLMLLLAGIGIAALYSASYFYAERAFGNPRHFLDRHLVFLVIGLVLAVVSSRLSLDFWEKSVPLILVGTLFLMVLTFIPGIGREIMGARRWILLGGNSFQPSELVKLAVVLYVARIMSKKEHRLDDFGNAVLPPLLLVGGFTALIYLQNDFSTAAFVLLVALIMFFVAGVRLIHFFFLFITIFPILAMLLFTKEHRVRRLLAFLDPYGDPVGTGYQVLASQTALSRGHLWGSGLGMGTKKLGGLPEAHSDFVFAVFGEETGFLGVLFVIALFTAFAVRGYMTAFKIRDKSGFGFYLVFGLTSVIFYQALLNMAVVCGLVPATGLPLPLFSNGGSSVLVTMMMCGIILGVSREAELDRSLRS